MTGQRVGSYEIVRVIARGGMAVVFLARQPALGRDVALKRVELAGGDPTIAHRFVLEAQLAGALTHPNIVMLYDFLEADGVPYIAMEFVSGGPLRKHMTDLTLPQIFGVLDGILAGLDHAESHGIAHRDLKPENVLVTPSGGIKLADFGIARAYNSLTQRLTNTGMAMGTPAYMAPEQAMADAVGPYTDLYAVGVMAYEMLAGAQPFRADTPMSVLYQHVNNPPPPLSGAAPDAPAAMCAWIERLLAKAPAERPQSADEASAALEQIAVDELGPLWRRQAPLPRSTPATTDEWETYGQGTPQARAPAPPPAPPEPQPPPPEPAAAPPAPQAAPPPEPAPEPPPEPAPAPPPAPEPLPAPAPPPEPEPEPVPAAPEPAPPPPRETPVTAPVAATIPPASSEWAETVGLPPQPPSPPPDGRRRRRWIVVAGGTLVIACVAAFVLLLGGGDPPDGEADKPPDGDPAVAFAFGGGESQQPVVGLPDHGAGEVVVVRPEQQVSARLEAAPDGEDASAAPAARDEGAQYGWSVAGGDFDGDGAADLAVGARGAGFVEVLYGTPDGLRDARREVLRGDGDRFGAALAAGDLDRDGRDELIVGAPGSDDDGGRLQVHAGTVDGLGGVIALDPPGGAAAGFGTRVRLGDVNGDGHLDVVEAGAGGSSEGHTTFCPGSATGPATCERVDAEGGSALAVGDVDGDDLADVVQGDPGDPALVAGEISILRGGADGPGPERLIVTQETEGVPGNDQVGDEFGGTVAVGRLDGDRFADIVVGAPGEDGVGRVTVIRGGPAGIARKGHRLYGHPDADAGAVFARAVTVLDTDGDGTRELVAGAVLPDGAVQLIVFASDGDRLRAEDPIDLDVEPAGGDPAEISLRLGRDDGGS